VTADRLGFVLLAAAGVVIAAIVAARLAHAAGLPALLVFLGLGLALGEAGLGVRFDNTQLAEVLGLSALVLILAEGGLTTNWAHARAAAPAALLLATVGVTVSVGVVAAVTRLLPGFSWRDSLLIGAILAPTDAAAVFSVLRKLPLPPKLAGILEGESGLNDPPAVLAVTLLSQTGPHSHPPALIVAEVAWQLVGGAAIGLAAGLLGALTLRRVALPASGLYPIAVLALIVVGYGAASQAKASGFLAVYVSAVVLGNAHLPHGPATRGFAEGIGWLAQIGLFVMLGLLASPARLPAQILPAIAVGLVLVFLARPAAVLAATLPLRLPRREQAFLSWAGLRGAVPIVLATIPISAHVAGSARLFDVVFIVVVVFTLVQGPTLPWAARRLGVIAPAEPIEVIVEAAPLEELHADLLQAQIPSGSKLHGVELFELRLPAQANLALVVRAGRSFVPGPSTVLQTGDRLLIVTPATVREQTERRLRAVSRAGKLAGWFGEQGRSLAWDPWSLPSPCSPTSMACSPRSTPCWPSPPSGAPNASSSPATSPPALSRRRCSTGSSGWGTR
jgi:cell volume regulation protein A